MGRPSKDGRYVNFYMSAGLFDELVKVADIEGRTKTAILEDALKQYIIAYHNEKGEINTVDAVYVKTKKPCVILDKIIIGRKEFYKIFTDEDVFTVPVRDVVK